MPQYIYNKPTAADLDMPLNHHSLQGCSIQNLTGADITITVTNQNPNRGATPVFQPPPQGALVIANGTTEELASPHVVARAAGTGTGEIIIVHPNS